MEPGFPLQRIVLPAINVYLLRSGEQYLLVDTGRRMTRKLLVRKLDELGVDLRQLSFILLTHTHFDHASGARLLKQMSGAKLIVHRSEARDLQRGYSPIPRGTRRKSKYISFIGRFVFPWLGFFPGVEPDLLVDKDLDLHDLGFPAKVYHVGGHTKGSMIVVLDSGEAIVGDILLGVNGPKRFPPFANDVEEVKKSWEFMEKIGITTMWPAHGSGVQGTGCQEQSDV